MVNAERIRLCRAEQEAARARLLLRKRAVKELVHKGQGVCPGEDGANTAQKTGNSHVMHGVEFQSTAIAEGFAHFYVAVAFNLKEPDCGFVYCESADYDGDGKSPGGTWYPLAVDNGVNR